MIIQWNRQWATFPAHDFILIPGVFTHFVIGFESGVVPPAILKGNIVFGQRYNMIHPPGEDPLRPTSTTEFTVRKRDKKPIISGGDH